jgi:hypothetical protein
LSLIAHLQKELTIMHIDNISSPAASHRHVGVTQSAILLLFLLLMVQCSFGQGYFQWIGNNGKYINPYALSADGNVAVGYGVHTYYNEAWRWDSQNGLQWLGWPPIGSTSNTFARGVSGDGSVVVGEYTYGGNNPYAFRWTKATGAQVLNSNGKQCFIWSIDSLGDIVVGSRVDSGASTWTSSGMKLLPSFGGRTEGMGISPDGSVIVGQDGSNAVYWSSGVETILPAPAGSAWASASHGNAIIGTAGNGAFRWTPSGGTVSLGDSTFASAISSDGSTIVGRRKNAGADEAAIWQYGSTTSQSLKDVCQNDYGIAVPGALVAAIGISSDGSAILGGGYISPGVIAGFRVELKKSISVLNPIAGSLWLADSADTIRWIAPSSVDSVNIYFSADNGVSLIQLEQNYPAHPGTYRWRMPADTMSAKCKIIIRDAKSLLEGNSGAFKVKGIYLTRLTADGQYERFDQQVHGYSFANDPDPVWPNSWWSRFNYHGTDPVTGNPYPGEAPFNIAKSSDFPDWPLWTRVFGTNECYWSLTPEVPREKAKDVWNSEKKEWGGSCVGFSLSTLLAFDDKISFGAAFPEMPSFGNLHSLSCDDGVRSVINQLMISQFGTPHVAYDDAKFHVFTPTQAVQEIRQMFLNEKRDDQYLGILNNHGRGGHAIVAYKLERDSSKPGGYWVYVYDNSYPADTHARIWVDTTANGGNGSWNYDTHWLNWGGFENFYLLDPVSAYRASPGFPKHPSVVRTETGVSSQNSAGSYQVYPARNSSVIITDNVSRRIGYSNDSVITEIPQAFPKISFDDKNDPPVGYTLPEGSYTVSMHNFTDSLSSLTVIADSFVCTYRHKDAVSSQTDRLYIGNTGGLAATNDDAAPKTIDLKIVREEQSNEKVYALSGIDLRQGDSMVVAPFNQDGLTISHVGAEATHFDLTIKRLSRDGDYRFIRTAILFEGNSAYVLVPDWNNFVADTTLKILIDRGNHGSFNDSITVSNQATNPIHPAPGSSLTMNDELWIPDGKVNAIARSGNTIYLGGNFSRVGPSTGHFAAIDTIHGSVNPGFPKINGSVQTIISDGNGGWFIGGNFNKVGKVTCINLVHLKADKTVDAQWMPNPDNAVKTLALAGSEVYVGGWFSNIGGQTRHNLASVDAATGLASSWAPEPDGAVLALTVSGPVLYAGGQFTKIGTQTRGYMAAFVLNTGDLKNWDPASDGYIYAIEPSGSKIYVGGKYYNIGGQSRRCIAVVDTGTALALDWNPGSSGYSDNAISSIIVSGAKIYAAGTFTSIGGQERNRIASLDAITGLATSWNPDASDEVTTIILSGSNIYACGQFRVIGGETRRYIASVDTASGKATAWDPNADKAVNTIFLHGAMMYAGGEFLSVGGVFRNNLAALDAKTGKATEWNPHANKEVLAIAISGSTMYAGGLFDSVGGQARKEIAALDLESGLAANWNPGANGPVLTLAFSDSKVYAGGGFDTIGGQNRSMVAALDAGTGLATEWNPNANNWPLVVTVSGPNVYIGGLFSTIGGQSRRYIAALDTLTGNATDWNPKAADYVYALAVSGSTVFAGGNFDSVGGDYRKGIAALEISSGKAEKWNPKSDGSVYTIAVSGSTVYAGGAFSSMNGTPRNHFAALDMLSGQTTNLNINAQGSVNTIGVYNSMVYAGGVFTDVDSTLHPYFAGLIDSALVTGVKAPIIVKSGIPKSYVLEQNYPNPFNPITTIRYQIPAVSTVSLKLYNILGQLVATLADGVQQAGYKQVQWNASRMASGVYFYRIEAISSVNPGKNFSQVKKMILMK